MNVSCAECASIFRVDPAKVPDGGVRARCSVCGAVFAVAAHADAAPLVAAAPPGAVTSTPLAAPLRPPAIAATPATAAVSASVAPPVAPPVAAPAVFTSAAATSAPVLVPPVAPAPRAPDAAPEVANRFGPRITPRAEPPRATATPATGAAAVPASSPTAGAASGGGPRRFNPYLSNDPSQKARRLARALVSDLVAYQPQKREEGLRAGNLKDLFRDEIRKSWEEYVAQIGAPVAESTTHFQDALNDVLAGGRKIF